MQALLQYALPVIGGLVVAACVVIVLQQRRSPQSAVLWIVILVTLPYVAVPVFAILGFRKRGWRFVPIRFTEAPAAETPHPTATMLTRLGAAPAVEANRVTLHARPHHAWAQLAGLLDEAEESIDAMFYLLADDDSGRWFVRRLTERALEGVRVRLHLDGLGAFLRPRPELRALAEAGGEVRFFSPLLHPPERGHLNLRNHRKMVIADDARVWTGGRNVGDEYLAEDRRVWEDLTMTVAGPVVQTFMDVFAAGWHLGEDGEERATARLDAPAGTATLQLVPSGPDEPGDVLHDGLVNAIHNATRRVWIATPYFVPTDEIDQALSIAARRGVDVRILVPERSNHRLTDLARGAYLRAQAAAGVRVLRFQPGMMHAKAALIDDSVMLGTANFDVRSMLLNFELALFVYDPETLAEVEAWYSELSGQTVEGLLPAGILRRVVEGVFRLGAPVL